jgi:DNA primase
MKISSQVLSNKPDIIKVIVNEGIELKQRGKAFWALCPIHSEKTPSFKVDPEKQSFYCFSCHERGDVISFIQIYKGFSFKESLRYLSISGKPIRLDTSELRRRELIKAFKHWCYERHDLLCSFYRDLYQAKDKVKTEKDLEKLAPFYHRESIWLYQIETFQNNDEEAKFELYKEIANGTF